MNRFILALFLMMLAIAARAQDHLPSAIAAASNPQPADTAYELKKADDEFGFWLGFAPNATSQLGGLRDPQARGLRMIVVGLRYGRIVAATKRFSFAYTVDVLPVASLLGAYVRCPVESNPDCTVFPHAIDARVRKAAYGFGVAPIGAKLNLRVQHRMQPFFSLAVGCLRFNREVPLPRATRFNFTAEAGGGVQILSRAGRAVMIGYKVHHLSNGGLGQANPGLNTNQFYVGFSIWRRRGT